jgi:hypothetical protein
MANWRNRWPVEINSRRCSREFLKGNLTRRQAMLRAAGWVSGAALAGPRLAGAAPAARGGATSFLAQDETPEPGGTIRMGLAGRPDFARSAKVEPDRDLEGLRAHLQPVDPDSTRSLGVAGNSPSRGRSPRTD